jgi:hypothetical protein
MKFTTLLLVFLAIILALFGYKALTIDRSHSKTDYDPAFGSTDPKVVELKKEIDSTMKSFLTTINSITDTASARQALLAIEKTSQELNGYLERMKTIPDDDKLQIKHYMMDFVKYLKHPLKRLSKVKGAAKIIDPAINKIDTVLMFYKPM